jgi:ribosomal protein S1
MIEFSQQEWNALIDSHPRGTLVSGEVVSCQIFGVFVRLDQLPEVQALLELIHFEILVADPNHRIKFPVDYPQLGSRINARILAWCLTPKDVRLTQLRSLDWCQNQRSAEPGA